MENTEPRITLKISRTIIRAWTKREIGKLIPWLDANHLRATMTMPVSVVRAIAADCAYIMDTSNGDETDIEIVEYHDLFDQCLIAIVEA